MKNKTVVKKSYLPLNSPVVIMLKYSDVWLTKSAVIRNNTHTKMNKKNKRENFTDVFCILKYSAPIMSARSSDVIIKIN